MLGRSRRLLNEPPPAGDLHPTVADTLLRQFTISVAYALVVIAFVDAQSYIGELVRGWIETTAGIVETVLVLVPEPTRSVGTGGPNGIGAYRHVLAASLAIATVSFVGSRSRWPCWAAQLRGRLRGVSGRTGRVREAALFGQSQMALGLIATVLLLLFGEWQLGETGNYLYAHSWTFLRAPLLAALALWFACYAVAFRLCIENLRARP
jgi:hypothetical protein